MGQQDPATLESPPTPPQQARSRAALARYRSGMRRRRAVYSGVVTTIVAALAAVVAVVWSHGEIAHTTLRTVQNAPPSISLAQPSVPLERAWSTDDRPALGTPYWGGTVITHSADSVRGRDARTGALTWSYTRTQRTVCTAIQVHGITLAIFKLNGNCDQVTALDSGTGQRQWTRTLDEDGNPLNGRPTYSISSDTILMTTSSVIYAIDPVSGIDRWIFNQGCRINGAVLGSQGALISQNCVQPDCGERKFCGAGPQLLLRDRTAGRDEDSEQHNPDQITWNRIGSTAMPVSADQLISAMDPGTGTLQILGAEDGKARGRVELTAAPVSTARPVPIETSGAELIWIDGVCYALSPSAGNLLWSVHTSAPPTVTPSSPGQVAQLSTARITVPSRSGAVLLDGGNGSVRARYPATETPARSSVYPFGTGFLVAGAATSVYR